METEDQLCYRYEKQLAAIAALDRLYYLNPSPTLAERAEYAARQYQLENVRSRYYAELRALREFRPCRLLVRRLRRRRP
jgi:hypothetical protein